MKDAKTLVGYSMLPSIFPGAILEVTPADVDLVQEGDILCYPGHGMYMVAHRVMRIQKESHQVSLYMRGDAQQCEEIVPGSAIAYRVSKIRQRFLSYDTASMVGRLFFYISRGDKGFWLLIRKTISRSCYCTYRFWSRRQSDFVDR